MRTLRTPFRHEVAASAATGPAFPAIRDLGVIGDRRTAAVLGADGTVYWYCPERFDRSSLLAALLDPGKGAWRVALPGARPAARSYRAASAVLDTRLRSPQGEFAITDWMTLGEGAPRGVLCRRFSPAPAATVISLDPWCENGCRRARLARAGEAVAIEGGRHLFASHALTIDEHGIHWVLPAGEEGWTVLSEHPIAQPTRGAVDRWLKATLSAWRDLASATAYAGPYADQVRDSLRALRLLSYAPSGAIVAAVTAGLPEVIGGRRNYDYRYAWLRDSAMMVRAYARMETDSREGDDFLAFIAASQQHSHSHPVDAVVAIDRQPVPDERNPPLSGYRESGPVRIGNRAGRQLQLGALGNFLLAADMIYRRRRHREHWDAVAAVADFLAARWRAPDNGIWESPHRHQFTEGKIMAACGLRAIAEYADPARAARYRAAVDAIHRWVDRECRTASGAIVAVAGGRHVDVSAALFPVWSFIPPDAPATLATMRALEHGFARGALFRRYDLSSESECEGAFLAGTFWVAQYCVARGDLGRARDYIEGGLAFANDLGLFPEEIDVTSGEMLGNLPMGIVHASFLSAVADYCDALEHRPG